MKYYAIKTTFRDGRVGHRYLDVSKAPAKALAMAEFMADGFRRKPGVMNVEVYPSDGPTLAPSAGPGGARDIT